MSGSDVDEGISAAGHFSEARPLALHRCNGIPVMGVADVGEGVVAKKTEFKDILASIDELAARGKISRNNAFAAWFAVNFFNVDEDEALESAAADGGNDQGVDIAFADENAQEIVILQAYCPGSSDKVTPKNKWDAITASMPFIEDPEQLQKAGRPDMAEAIAALKKSYPDFRIAYGLISLGKKSNEIIASIEAHKASSKGKEVSFFFYSQDDIIEQYDTQANAASGIAEDTLTFTGSHIEDEGEYGRSWIGSVSAAELQRLHHSHADNLFAGNIRLFLGSRKGGINEQIIKTAKEQPGAFWALNNGITIVADTAEVIKKSDAKDDSQLRLRRFSIVNGCQTTSSLVEAKAKPTAKVLARVIAANAKIKIDIVQFNNSQNAVKIWTVRAADETQNNLRAKFHEIGIQYAPKLEGSRRARNSSIIELDRLTQFLASTSSEYLVQAIGNKGELFDQPYQKLFHRTITATEVYLAWLVGNIADTERTSLLNGIQKDDENAGLLAVTSNYWIVYATYKLLAKTKRNSPQITLVKMKAPEFQNALRKYVEKGAELFYDAAIDTYDRDDYGSFKSTLRATKFLSKMDSKLNLRIAKPLAKPLPDLVNVCKSIKVV